MDTDDDLQVTPHAKLLAALSAHREAVTGMAWSPDGEWLASTSRDGTLHLWSRIPAQTQPRFARQSSFEPSPALTGVAWSHDGQYLACGSTAGHLALWEHTGCRPITHDEPDVKSAIRCVAWGVGRDADDRRLAFGEERRLVHFRNYRDWTRPDVECGIGHQWPILAVAWSPDGKLVVTGTSGGTIGVWTTSHLDNELRALLTWKGTQAHEGPVTTLDFCARTGVLASGGQDGRVHLWDVENGVLNEQLTMPGNEEVLDLEFAHNGEVIVVQSLHHIRFLRRNPLREIAAFYHPASLTPVPSTIAVSTSSRLATVDPKNRAVISVWQVDFASMLKESDLSRRPYRAAAVSLLGEPGSGRTNIALTLAGDTFSPEHSSHSFHVHRLRVADGIDETREISLWDLPTGVDHALVHRVHAEDGAVALMVLCPVPGTRATSPKNLGNWSQTLRRWNTVSRSQPQRSIVVVTKCDEFEYEPDLDDAETVAQALNVEKVVMTSAKTGLGIADLRVEIVKSIDWAAAASFPSRDVLDLIVTFVAELRTQKRFLTSTRDLYESFVRVHPYVSAHLAGEAVFRHGVQLLEVLGVVELFEKRDEIVLDPRYYHTYASAMIAGAERDEMGMGRLPLRQAEMGRGEQMHLEESERLPDPKQEERLLALTINELVVCGVAQKVSTDGVSHLVFPISLTRLRDASESRPSQVTAFRFVGEAQNVFSSMIVRLLSLSRHYLKPELWKNEAMFSTPSGGCCGVVLEPTDQGDEAGVSVHCDEKASKIERRQFLDMVRDHIDTCGRIVSTKAEAEPSDVSIPSVLGGPVEVFLCWRGSKASRTTAENVRVIAAQLRDKGIQTVGDVLREVGDAPHEHWSRVAPSRVALILVAGPLSTQQDVDFKRLEETGCRMIPVILPNAVKDYELPSSLQQWESIDLRGRFLDTNVLADAVKRAWLKGPVQRKAIGRVFLSYSRTDSEQTDRLRKELEDAGHSVWWDRRETDLALGKMWQEEIREAIRTSYAFIWCVSDSSVRRPQSWVYPEIAEAIAIQQVLHPSRIFIIPVRLSECELPELRIDSMRSIRQLQWFDYFDRRGNVAGLIRVLDMARAQAVPAIQS